MTVRARLLVLVALATIVPAILLGIRFLLTRSAEIESAMAALSLQASSIAEDLDGKIQGTAQLHFGLARAIDLDGSRAQCSAFLSAVREEYPQYTGILTISHDGRLFCDSLQTDRELDLTDRPYFQKALATYGVVTIQPAFGRLTGISVLQIAYPVRSALGELKFVSLASLSLQSFGEFHSRRLPPGQDLLLLDKSGVVLVSPSSPEWTGRLGTSIADTDLFRLAASQNESVTREIVGIDGSKQFWAAVGSPAARDTGLYIMVGISRSSLVAAADTRLYQEFAIVGFVLLLLFTGVWRLAETGIRRPLSRISAMTERLAAGDLSARVASPFPAGDLGRLMEKINVAAESLELKHAAIDELNQQLYHSQQTETRTKNFLDAVIEHIPNPIAVKAVPASFANATCLSLTLVNKAYEEFSGLSRAELIGKTAYNLDSAEAIDIVTSDSEALKTNAPIVVQEYSLARVGKASRIVTIKKVAIRDNEGVAQYVLTVLDDVTEQRRSQQLIAHMAHHDTLTDLPNRAAFNKQFAAAFAMSATHGTCFTILSIDLNRFKEANDTYGHATGDKLLQMAALRLRATAAGSFVARVGGDEFTIIVIDGAAHHVAAALAERLLSVFVDHFDIDGNRIQLGLSIGGAVYPVDGTDAKTLMSNADTALYQAKSEQRASARFFQPEMAVRQQKHHEMQQDLRAAITNGALRLHYQPQCRLTGEVVGMEALARWTCPQRGMVSPATFIPIAEKCGLITLLGEWALREACQEAASWPLPLKIAVNVSPLQFRQDDFASLVHSVLLETGLAPSRLELEITEGVLINDFPRAVSILRRLKTLGVQIALDDFGKGYSSLSYLHSFAFDKIKIDKEFVSDLQQNRHSMAIARAVIGLGHSLGIPVLAEGVETKRQHSLLAHEGCDQVQGYFIGRPLPIREYNCLVGRQSAKIENARNAP